MEPNAPDGYMLCQNDACKNAADCLRQIFYKTLTGETRSVNVLNPLCWPKENEDCAAFRSSQKIKVAWGVKHFYAKLPHENAENIRRALISHFGKTKYYRFFREARPILPRDQNIIKAIFTQNGIASEPAYTRFTDEYDWTW